MTYLILGRLTMWRLLRIVGLLAGLGFMGWLLARLVTNPHLLQGQLAIIGFIEAVVIGIIANAGVSIVFSDMVGKSAPDIGLGKRFTAFYYAQIAKYIPGRIAALMVQRSVLTGPNGTTATITSNIELMAVSSWLCGGAALVLLTWPLSKAAAVILTLAVILIGALTLRIDWWRVVRLISTFIPTYRNHLERPPATHQISKLRALGLSSAVFALPAASSYCLLVNGLGIGQGLALELCALLLMSWVGGLLAFVFPAGIGIREFIFFSLGGMLSHAPDTALMAGIALASRVTQILIDIVGVLLFLASRWLLATVKKQV